MGRVEIRISGFGGQGIVLTGQIIGQAASIYDDGFATFSQSYGPESRGGSCTAEVVISNKPIDYPYVQSPQVLIILSQEAYAKYVNSLPKGTLVIIDSDLVKLSASHNPAPLSIPGHPHGTGDGACGGGEYHYAGVSGSRKRFSLRRSASQVHPSLCARGDGRIQHEGIRVGV